MGTLGSSPLFHTEEYNILGQECGRQLRDGHGGEEEDLPRGHCAMPSLDVVVRRMFAGTENNTEMRRRGPQKWGRKAGMGKFLLKSNQVHISRTFLVVKFHLESN